MEKIIKILKLGRIYFIVPGFLIFLSGTLFSVLTSSNFEINKLIFGYIPLFLSQLSVSYSNDYYDMESDKKSSVAIFSGGSKVLVNNPELKYISKWIALSLIILSLISAVTFTLIFKINYIFLIIIVLVNMIGWFYNAAPIKFSYRNLGELAIIMCLGIALPVTGYMVLSNNVSFNLFIFTVPFAIYSFVFALNVEIPDFEADRYANKKNLISNLGRKKGFYIMLIASLIGTVYLFVISFVDIISKFIDYKIYGYFSLFPFITILITLIYYIKIKKFSAKLIIFNISSLLLFLIFNNIYIYILIRV
ncbi:MAG: prenyltransferase [Actinobacteria bacterium]|nr:prenyltransferase [Actinomycetota bacterium]